VQLQLQVGVGRPWLDGINASSEGEHEYFDATVKDLDLQAPV
jgi:hypothetical protein